MFNMVHLEEKKKKKKKEEKKKKKIRAPFLVFQFVSGSVFLLLAFFIPSGWKKKRMIYLFFSG